MEESTNHILTSDIAKSCLTILKREKFLVFLPVLSAVTIIAVSALLYVFVLLSFGIHISDIFSKSSLLVISNVYDQHAFYFAVIYGFVMYSIVIYFENALSLAVYNIALGGDPTLKESLWVALKNIKKILALAVLFTVAGTIFKVLERKYDRLGSRVVIGIASIGWSFLIYFVLPITAIEKLGILESIKKSGVVFKNTWGENVVGQIRLFFFFVPYYAIAILAFIGAIYFESSFLSPFLIILGILGILAISITNATVNSIFKTVLYIYASTGKVTHGFIKESLGDTFKAEPSVSTV